MTHPYVHGPALLAACSSGQGAIVIVEGETFQEDRYYYGQWFGERAREISFFPQNGWQKVVNAVAELRLALTHRAIFGIIDRDFATDAVLSQQDRVKPTDHVFRTRRFTVENYLLEPAGWLRVAQVLTRNTPPPGWQTEVEVAARIDEAYEACVDISAFNYTVRQEYDRAPGAGIEYKKNPKAISRATTPPETELQRWGASRSAPKPLDRVYFENRAFIRALSRDARPMWISGKAVLNVFLDAFAVRSVPHEHLKSIYLDKHPTPPADVAAIVTRIVERDGHP